jgi:hypothetical protein
MCEQTVGCFEEQRSRSVGLLEGAGHSMAKWLLQIQSTEAVRYRLPDRSVWA